MLGYEENEDHSSFCFQLSGLDAAYSLISVLRPVVAAVGRHDRSLRDQLRRAGSSIPLNLAEGFGLQGGHEKQRFLTALGSAREVAVIIEVARRWDYVSSTDADDALRAVDRVAAMTYRLPGASAFSAMSREAPAAIRGCF